MEAKPIYANNLKKKIIGCDLTGKVITLKFGCPDARDGRVGLEPPAKTCIWNNLFNCCPRKESG
jgi:hypothetical protein